MRNRTRSLHLSLCEVYPHCHPPPRHLLFSHNQHFLLCGLLTKSAVLAWTLRVKSCDTGSFLQAALHLQMSGSRFTHAGETSCCVTPSELLWSCAGPGDFSLCGCWIIQMLHVRFICLFLFSLRKLRGWRYQSEARIAFSGHGDSTFSLQNNLHSLHYHFLSAGTIVV